MIKDYFGEWTNGTLGRGRFAMLYLGVVIVAFLTLFLVMNIGPSAVENPTGPRNLINGLPPIAKGLLSILMIGLQIAVLNIVSKRGRDIGVSGLVTAVVFVAVIAAGFLLVREAGGMITLGFVVLLALIPSGQLAKKAGA